MLLKSTKSTMLFSEDIIELGTLSEPSLLSPSNLPTFSPFSLSIHALVFRSGPLGRFSLALSPDLDLIPTSDSQFLLLLGLTYDSGCHGSQCQRQTHFNVLQRAKRIAYLALFGSNN
ncbi:hypothetical protein SLEP1_g51880 [Rubroshorea leprosula]|uniref:Uncharacterized protein n=1 Tax=Rubroshorea leprosula TaxID=152421 RepID=A0AAV5M4K9_9ROSI|nr:hypothetical protein SLEP1_g51880 [Rubroshorea leprosula]